MRSFFSPYLLKTLKSHFQFSEKKHPLRYRSHPYLIYENTPNLTSIDGRNTNDGLTFRRGITEVKPEKEDGTVRVVCMGESTTYCLDQLDEDTYPSRLQVHLSEKYQNKNIEVVNAGVPGYCSQENIVNFIFKIQPLNPDLIVYYYTYNDLQPRMWQGLTRDFRTYSRPWRETFTFRDYITGQVSYAKMGSQTTSGNGVSYFTRCMEVPHGPNYIDENTSDFFRDNIRSIGFLAKAWGINFMVINPPFYGLDNLDFDPDAADPVQRGMYQHRAVIEELAKKDGFPLLDMLGMMPSPPKNKFEPNEHFVDSVHFSDKGADVFADIASSFIYENSLLALGKVRHD